MNKLNLAYLAGILDGEGCITLAKVYRKDNRNKNPKFVEECWGQVCIAWTDKKEQKEYLEELKKEFGGYYALFKSRAINGKGNDFVYWRLVSNKSAEFLKLVIPYLRVKKRQAEIVIRMHELKLANRGKHKEPSLKEMNDRQELIKEIRLLNKRGK